MKNIYTLTLWKHRRRSIYHLKDTIKQRDVFMVFRRRLETGFWIQKRLNSVDVVRHSAEKPHNTCTARVVSSIVFESSYCLGSSEQNISKEFYGLLVWLSISILCLIWCWFVSLTSCNILFWQSLIMACLYFDGGKKKPWY